MKKILIGILFFCVNASSVAQDNIQANKLLTSLVNFSNNLAATHLMESLLMRYNYSNKTGSQPIAEFLSYYQKIAANSVTWQMPAKLNSKSQAQLFNANVANGGGEPLNVCMAQYKFSIYPGRLTPQGCLITYAGQIYVEKHYVVLAGKQHVEWVPLSYEDSQPLSLNLTQAVFKLDSGLASDGSCETNNCLNNKELRVSYALVAGYEQDNNQAVYLCRLIYQNKIYIGKYSKSFCHVAVDGKEKNFAKYFDLLQVTAPEQK